LAPERLLWRRYIADKTNLNGQKHQAALVEYMEVGLGERKNTINKSTTKKKN